MSEAGERLERLAEAAFPKFIDTKDGAKEDFGYHRKRMGYVAGYRAALDGEEVRGSVEALESIVEVDEDVWRRHPKSKGMRSVTGEIAFLALARFRGESK